MVTLVNAFAANGVKYLYYGTLNGNYLNGTSTTTLANGSSSGMGRLTGITGVSVAEPDSAAVQVLGNNGVLTQFLNEPQELPNGSLNMTSLDQAFNAVATGVVVQTDGEYKYLPGFPACLNFADIAFVINSPAKSTESATLGSSGWVVTEVFRVNAQMKSFPDIQTATVQELSSPLILNRSSYAINGVIFTTLLDGTTQMAWRRYWSEYPVTYHVLKGNAALTTVTLNETPIAATGAKVQLWLDGVAQVYTTNYTVNTSTKVFTFVAAPGAGVNAVVRYQHSAVC